MYWSTQNVILDHFEYNIYKFSWRPFSMSKKANKVKTLKITTFCPLWEFGCLMNKVDVTYPHIIMKVN